jgi:hypothetical protein
MPLARGFDIARSDCGRCEHESEGPEIRVAPGRRRQSRERGAASTGALVFVFSAKLDGR